MKKVTSIYEAQIAEDQVLVNKQKHSIHWLGSIKLVLILLGAALLFYFRQADTWWLLGGTVLLLSFFQVLDRKQKKTIRTAGLLSQRIQVCQWELDAIRKRDYSPFAEGNAFIDSTHLYTYDLDVFGPHSLFQYLNHTGTQMGERCLAEWLNRPLETASAIRERQEAVKELNDVSTRLTFQAEGLYQRGNALDEEEIKAWAQEPILFGAKSKLRYLPIMALCSNIALFSAAYIGWIPYSLWGIIFLGFICISVLFTQKISKMQLSYGKKLHILNTYSHLMNQVEQSSYQSPLLQEVQHRLLHPDEQQYASKALTVLNKRLEQMDQRNNVLMLVLLNGLFFWELRMAIGIEQWKERFAKQLPGWLNAVGEMDALNALATFAFNHPESIYPDIQEKPFCLQAQGLTHPLMMRSKCIANDIEMNQSKEFFIVTGANMAGKSTYLRTVGVNYLLACMGATVCATSMSFYPAKLVTSLRTTDSLNENESYFYAELKRLKLIIEKLQDGETLFILLDEILKGTNSLDKQKGSLALVKQFIHFGTNGIIATHDLMLGSLKETFPEHIRNFCFEAEITNKETNSTEKVLTFSYRMKEGIAQNMNACFLMKQMGIAIPEQ